MIRSRKLAALGVAAASLMPVLAASAASATTVPSDEDLDGLVLDYTGGTAGEAAGDPIRIGYANSEPFSPSRPSASAAAVEYVNAELGGVRRTPDRDRRVPDRRVADGAAAAPQFANDDSIALVLTGTISSATRSSTTRSTATSR